MQPLLKYRSRSINQPERNDRAPRLFNKYWDRATLIINLLRHFYSIILICYYWEQGTAETSIGQTLLIIYLSLGVILSCIGFVVIGVIAETIHKMSEREILMIVAGSLSITCQPGFILFVFINEIRINDLKELFYFTIFANILLNGLPIYLALCYYLVPHPSGFFNPAKIDEFLIIIYFILFFLSIITIYPIFVPLHSINKKHLLYKLSSFSVQVIRTLFTLFLMVSYYFSTISVTTEAQYIYDFYLMQFFEITPILCIWTTFYTVNFHYFEVIDELFERLLHFSVCKAIFFGLCWVIIIFIFILGYPFLILYVIALSIGIYWWFIFECWCFNMIESFIFVNTVDMVFDEIKTNPNLEIYKTWSAICEYLTDINDSIGYRERLYILQYLSSDENELNNENMEAIIVNQGIKEELIQNKHGFICYFVMHFLKSLEIYTEKVVHRENIRDDFGLLHFYDFDTKHWKFRLKHIVYIIWELCGLFVILPIFVISIIMVTIICPFVLFILYFNTFTEVQHSYLSDFKLWILFIYLMMLLVAGFSFPEQYKLVTIWYDCQFLDIVRNNNHINKQNIRIYHNHIHEFKMIYDILTTFLGELSILIMEYVGIISDGSLNILSLNEYTNLNSRISHKGTVACSQYLFEIESYT